MDFCSGIKYYSHHEKLVGFSKGDLNPKFIGKKLNNKLSYVDNDDLNALVRKNCELFLPKLQDQIYILDIGGIQFPQPMDMDTFKGKTGLFGHTEDSVPEKLPKALKGGCCYRDVRLLDIDGDGARDIVRNIYADRSKTVEKNGVFYGTNYVSDKFFESESIAARGETLLVADIDGDNQNDIYFINYHIDSPWNQTNRLYLQTKPRIFSDKTDEMGLNSLSFSRNPEGIIFADLDGDGFEDIHVSGTSLIWDNDKYTKRDIGLPDITDEGLAIGDLNNDGIPEVVINMPDEGVAIYSLNPISKHYDRTSFTVAGFPTEPRDNRKSVFGMTLADVNNDGFLDILLAGGSYDGREKLRYPPRVLVNMEDFDFVEVEPFKNQYFWSDLVLGGDLDNDGTTDAFFRFGGPNYHVRALYYKDPKVCNTKLEILNKFGGRTLYGASAKFYLENFGLGTPIRYVDWGNGYMSRGPYPINLPIAIGDNKLDKLVNVEINAKGRSKKYEIELCTNNSVVIEY